MYNWVDRSNWTKPKGIRFTSVWLPAVAALLASIAAVAKPAAQYLTPEPLPKIAVLIGASRYSNLPELKNVPKDIDSLYDALNDLGFGDILVVSNPCLEDIKEAINALENRVMQLAPDGGAIVWVFLAGHGAMDTGHNQYLIPVNFDRMQLANHDYYQVAQLTAGFEEALKKVYAGAGLVVVDACRTPFPSDGSSVEAPVELAEVGKCKEHGSLTWRKLSNLPFAERIGYVKTVQFARVGTAYSTRPGAEAPEVGDPSQPGTYVNALVGALRGATPQIPDIFTEAFEKVTTSANKAYYPIEPDFRPKALRGAWLGALSESKQKENEALWISVLTAGEHNPETVRRYVETNSTSEYLRSALRWLRDRDLLAAAQQVTIVDGGRDETLGMRITESRRVSINRHPVEGVRQASVQRSLQNELIVVEQSGWGRLASASGDQPRYIRLESLVNDSSGLPSYWEHVDVLDATECIVERGGTTLCLAQLLQINTQHLAHTRLNVLAVEAAQGIDGDSPSSVAFRQAFEVQRALDELGVAYSRSRIRIVPSAFAPAVAGRVLMRVSNLKGK